MKAGQISAWGLENLKITEVSEPPKPGKGEVLVRMRAASLNFRDYLVVNGKYNPKFPLPMVPLSDGAGEVAEVGEEVTRFSVGDKVLAQFAPLWISGNANHQELRTTLGGPLDGTLREYAVFPETALVSMPDHLTFEEGATLPCAALTAWSALFVENKLQPGEVVVVQGTGGVSLFALQFAKMTGARVIVTSSSEEKLERAKEFGADELINYRSTPDWEKEVKKLTDGEGADHIIEVGGAGTLQKSVKCVKHFGVVHLIGVLAGGSGEFHLLPVVMSNVRLQGVIVGSRKSFESMNAAISSNRLKPVVDKTFSMAESKEAIQYLKDGKHFGKIAIQI